jgi:hypothetical protein
MITCDHASNVSVCVSSVEASSRRTAQSKRSSRARLPKYVVHVRLIAVEEVVRLTDRVFLDPVVAKLQTRTPKSPPEVVVDARIVKRVIGRSVATRTKRLLALSIDEVHVKLTPRVHRMIGRHF